MSAELAKLSDRRLADEFGAVKARAKAETSRLKVLTTELVRRGKLLYVGASFHVLKVPGEQLRFDSAAVKIEMGDAWYEAHKRAVTSVEWVATAKPAPGEPAAAEPVAKPKIPKPKGAAAKALETA